MSNRGVKPYSAPPFGLLHRPGDKSVFTLDVPGYRQSRNYSCGYAAVLMVLRYFEKTFTGQSIFDALGTARTGTGQSAIVRVLRRAGVSANVRYDMGFDRIVRSVSAGKVLVSYLVDEEHWVVLYGYGESPSRIYVADPEPGKECEQEWPDYGERLGGFAIVCSDRSKRIAC